MGTYTSPSALLRAQKDRFRSFQGTRTELHAEVVRAGLRDHLQLTSGRLSSRTLRAMGHPFGRGTSGKTSTATGLARGIVRGSPKSFAGQGRKGQVSARGVVASLPINKQSGGLRRSLRQRGPNGPSQTYEIYFDAGVARYAPLILSPTGTKRMINRGFYVELRKRHAARQQGILMRARDAQRKG